MIDRNDKTNYNFASDILLIGFYSSVMKNEHSDILNKHRILPERPTLMSLLGKTLFNNKSFQLGQALPELSNEIQQVNVDLKHLHSYQKVCGFGISRTLPATYLSMLGFPLILELMTRDNFPMRAMGQVHLRNSISVFKSISLEMVLSFKTAIIKTEITDKGVEWTVESTASADQEKVWSSRSTMLHRCKTEIERSAHPALCAEGEPQLWRIESDTGRNYAGVSGDYNPIHLSNITAKMFGFNKAIVHGMWSKARCLAAMQVQVPKEKFRVNVAFQKPLFLPSDVQFFSHKKNGTTHFQLFNKSGQHAHLDGFITEDLLDV
tara:strand:+ start:806 stop:1768 length:963 start_codon:yes stop_codon:yes gene_type:complete